MAPPTFKSIFESNVPARMRDGTILYADVWRPDAPGRFPVLLQRTPYGKTVYAHASDFGIEPIRAATQGYVVIWQDTRGRFTSEGEFHPFQDDYEDGYDTVEWAATLPYSSGNVGMFGGSYGGGTQWMAAIQRPPHLKAIFPIWCNDGRHEASVYPGGAFHLSFILSWALGQSADPLLRRLAAGQDVGDLLGSLQRTVNAMPQAYAKLPLKGSHPLLNELAPYYEYWLDHPEYNAYWERLSVIRYLEQVTIPVYSLGGWFDLYAGPVPRLFSGMRERGGSDFARRSQKLIVGPWAHGVSSDQIGDIYFGSSAMLQALDSTGMHLRWYDYWLKGVKNGIMDEPPVKLFVMGANTWRYENEWPLARTQWTNYYLHSDGQANSAAGNGLLSPATPVGDELPDGYVYDPRNPVPTLGGGTLLPGNNVAANCGPKEQRLVEAREDVLVYSTAPLTQDIEVTGPISVTLFAATSAPDTDWTAKLVDVYPDGRAYNLADGIIRARYRQGTDKAILLKPGEVCEYKIDLQATCNVFKEGHRIRVQISSSNFPRFDRNPNTGRTIATETELVPAMQTVFHDPARPSHITLPIIPPSGFSATFDDVEVPLGNVGR